MSEPCERLLTRIHSRSLEWALGERAAKRARRGGASEGEHEGEHEGKHENKQAPPELPNLGFPTPRAFRVGTPSSQGGEEWAARVLLGIPAREDPNASAAPAPAKRPPPPRRHVVPVAVDAKFLHALPGLARVWRGPATPSPSPATTPSPGPAAPPMPAFMGVEPPQRSPSHQTAFSPTPARLELTPEPLRRAASSSFSVERVNSNSSEAEHPQQPAAAAAAAARALVPPTPAQGKRRGRKPGAQTGHLPHKCKYCKMAFAKPSWRERHERTHTGERPFPCPFPNCGKSFSRSDRVTVHLRIHTGERPYKCETCGKAFPQSGDVIRHRSVHRR